jgi:hypothetical protein
MRDAPGDLNVPKGMLFLLNSARRSESLMENHSEHVVNLPGDGSNSYITDWRYPETYPVDSPRADK